ncbi:hypothetical protein R1sor_010721 [Riccia sorocarpa]|uniref:Uncharacterized protein n=1 Tax=Riccia sorocarpa TaxID=122646 RepID=A0ABD3HYU8_9MARC
MTQVGGLETDDMIAVNVKERRLGCWGVNMEAKLFLAIEIDDRNTLLKRPDRGMKKRKILGPQWMTTYDFGLDLNLPIPGAGRSPGLPVRMTSSRDAFLFSFWDVWGLRVPHEVRVHSYFVCWQKKWGWNPRSCTSRVETTNGESSEGDSHVWTES